MASIRKTKKEVAYLANEIISNCYLALYFQPHDRRDPILDIIGRTVQMHNELIDEINHPADKKNAKLVRKHYNHVRAKMFGTVDTLFTELSQICQGK